ncbi:MAG: PSD1 and planctomycete cytochrome C domain-containing protein [Verrucomicrobiales bacterium]
MFALHRWLAFSATVFPLLTLPSVAESSDGVDFRADVKPLLSDACYHCHGPDAHTREAGLRLDTADGAMAVLKSGERAIVPGDAAASAMVQRITSTDPDEVMPPPDAQVTLNKAQIATLTQWIASGAKWSEHWALVSPEAHLSADPSESSPIDQFIQKRLQADGFPMSPAAPKETLIRRLSLDLRGLPPSPDEVDTFVNDASADAWERLVDRYLASVHTAERLTMDWLDAARYADTNGYSIDDHRDMWAWRDWVIAAFDRNLPYDQFLTEQLAGDLIPGATPQQVMATGFLRNSMNTHEGGTIPEEYRVAYVADKVDTVATVFMGLTMKCAQCHDHKYDPIAMRDYYSFFAFFNTTDEPGQGPGSGGNAAPFIEVESPFISKEVLQSKARAREEWLRSAHNEDTQSFKKEVDYFDQVEQTGTTTVMVMNLKPRETFMLERGQYNKPGELVTAGTPASLPALTVQGGKGTEATRLDLAKWLTQPDHPLTARVAVNRYWQFLFGTGLVKTAEDFGSQGELPSHPELLDWLAVRFVDSGWDVKSLLKDMVMSDTYKQTTTVSPELLEADPENRLLGRAPRHRLPAEIVRDNALAIVGLLVPEVGGPGVYPYQPEGLWKEVSHYGPHAFTAMAYWQGTGTDHYRRSMYSFWKRTSSSAARASGLRCTLARDVHHLPPEHEHTHSGACAHERSAVRRSLPMHLTTVCSPRLPARTRQPALPTASASPPPAFPLRANSGS